MKVEQNYPKGAIRHKEDVLDCIKQAQKENIEIHLYVVNPLGYMQEVILDKNSSWHYEQRSGGFSLFFDWKVVYSDGEICEYQDSALDMNIIRNEYNDHFLFTHKKHAENYFAYVKQSEEHKRANKEHLEFCKDLFYELDDWDYDDEPFWKRT